MKELEACTFRDHQAGKRHCRTCASGYPQRCGCGAGGLIHAEIVHLRGDGFLQITRCDQCGRPSLGREA